MQTQAGKTLKFALTSAVLLVPGAMAMPSAQAQTYTLLF